MKKKHMFVLVLILSLVLAGSYMAVRYFEKDEEIKVDTDDINSYQEIMYNGQSYMYNSNIRTLLMLGIDGKESDSLSGQSDFMALMVFNSETGEFNCLMIPRDTMTVINVNDSKGEFVTAGVDHITLAYPYGGSTHYYGAQNSLTAVSNLLNGVPLRNFIIMPLDILRDLVKILGETDIKLEDDSLSYIDENYKKGYNYHIDEESIEIYLRSRDTSSDFSAGNRTDRQIIYLRYMMSKMKDIQDGKLSLTFEDLDSIMSKCETNLTNTELNSYYNYMLEAEYSNDSFKTIPGKYKMGEKYDEFHFDVNGLTDMIVELFYTKN